MIRLKLSLRTRIFLAMTFLVLIASVLIVAITIYQYKEEAESYHRKRLARKENRLKIAIDNVLKSTTFTVNEANITNIFRYRNRIFQIAEEHTLPITIYDLSGSLLISSEPEFMGNVAHIPTEVIDSLSVRATKRYLVVTAHEKLKVLSSYSYITDYRAKPLAILNLPYLENNDLITRQLFAFLSRLAQVYLIMLLVAILLAYFLSKYIIKSLRTISETIDQTRLDRPNNRIEIGATYDEIHSLITAYNSMVDELEISAIKLAKSEREAAWREMAKQVAHEIKNPLTPMRLTIQNFERKFDPSAPDISSKLKEYSQTLIQQIDTMSAIASAFSDFAQMPNKKIESISVAKIVRGALDIFDQSNISFYTDEQDIIAEFDKTQLIRIVTNLVKNAIQAIPSGKEPKIEVRLHQEKDNIILLVTDNGVGIEEKHKKKIFEPKFTTKTSGMGLGLGMIKNIIETYGGAITFMSEQGKGTTFRLVFPVR